jgi:hypothetical protein
MRTRLLFPSLFIVLSLLISQGCAPVVTPTSKPIPATSTPTAKPTITPSPTPTATGSANAARPVPAGKVVLNWTAGNHTPELAFDGHGQLNLFFQTTTSAGAHAVNQARLNADGTWTTPIAVSAEFQFFVNLTAVPDMSGRLCILWSGEQYDQSGNAVDGLYRNCQQADGTWQVQAQPLAIASGPAAFAPARAPDGSLQSVFVTQSSIFGLYYSPIASKASTALTGTSSPAASRCCSGGWPLIQTAAIMLPGWNQTGVPRLPCRTAIPRAAGTPGRRPSSSIPVRRIIPAASVFKWRLIQPVTYIWPGTPTTPSTIAIGARRAVGTRLFNSRARHAARM